MNDYFIATALKLARKGQGKTFPNPMVGAVIVKDGHIIGKGYHKKAGYPHAEIEAIRSAIEPLQGASLYVTLEPCSHSGQTPPCTDAIIAAGIKKVVCSVTDPNPLVHGKGIVQLKKAGIEVSIGILEKEVRLLNEQFFTFHTKKRSYIAIKYAASLDGKLATASGDSKWITNEAARTYGRKLRSRYQAILVGANTVLRDDPHLGTRLPSKPDPLRIILDSKLRTPLDSQVLRDQHVLIATTSSASQVKMNQFVSAGFTVITFDSIRVPLAKLIEKLREMNIISVLVEGGGEVIGDFVDKKLVDRMYGFYSPILIGGAGAVLVQGSGVSKVADALHIKQPHIRYFGDNFLIEGST